MILLLWNEIVHEILSKKIIDNTSAKCKLIIHSERFNGTRVAASTWISVSLILSLICLIFSVSSIFYLVMYYNIFRALFCLLLFCIFMFIFSALRPLCSIMYCSLSYFIQFVFLIVNNVLFLVEWSAFEIIVNQFLCFNVIKSFIATLTLSHSLTSCIYKFWLLIIYIPPIFLTFSSTPSVFVVSLAMRVFYYTRTPRKRIQNKKRTTKNLLRMRKMWQGQENVRPPGQCYDRPVMAAVTCIIAHNSAAFAHRV